MPACTIVSSRSSAELGIRPATPADSGRIAAMCAALSAAAGLGKSSRLTAEAFRRDGFGPDPAFSCLIAEVGGEPLGYALYCGDYDTQRLWRSLYLADLYVERAGRARGIGRALMATVARAGRADGARAMMWGLLSSNLRARRFYASIGEEIADRIATWVGGAAFDALAAAGPPSDGLVLRTAVAADGPLLARFLLSLTDEIRLPRPADAAERLRVDGFGADPAFTAVIAERAGEPLGYALFWPTYDTEGSRRRGGWLSDLYVVPAARRGGIGMQLMAEVARRTAARNGSYLRWLVHATNAPARVFYGRFAQEWHKGFVCLCAGDRFDTLAESAPTGTSEDCR